MMPPPPHPFASTFVACRSRSLPIIRRLLSSRNLAPTLVACRRCHHPLSSHRPPPCHLARCIVRRPPSAQRHCRRRHPCNPILIPTALVAPSTSNWPLSAHFSPTTAIVTSTPSLLRPLSLRLPPPALVALSHRQRDNIAPALVAVMSRCSRCKMLVDISVSVGIGVDCVCLALATLGGAALPRPISRCSRRSPPPL